MMSRREYHVDLTTGGTTYVPGKDGAIKTYLNAVPYDHILTMTLPYIGRYTMGCNDEDNPETVARNTVVRLGISASSNVGARLITEIKEKILSVLPLLGSSSAQPSKSLTSADLPNTFNTKFDNPFTEVLYPKLLISHQLSSSTDREQDENPLSNPIRHLFSYGIDPPKPFMLKKHSLGHTCNESKGLCPECKCKHYVNDTVCDFMVSFSTYKGIVDVGWNLDECGSDKACLANVEKAFRKAGVVHIPLDDVNKDMISANKALISLLKTEHSSEYNAELKRLRDERERLALAEKKKDAEISQNITRLKEEAKAREQNMSRISEAIKADRMNRQRDTTNTLQKGKGAIVYGSGISNNVASMKDLFSTSDPNKVIAPDGTVELKPPPPKSNKPAAAVRTHFATTTTAIVPGTWGDPEAVISSLDEKKMSNPDYVDALVARACEDKVFYHAIEMHVENPFCAFIYLQTFTKMRDNPPPPPPSLAERPLITRRPERTGHVLDDDSASASASVSGGTVFSYAKHATATPAGDPPRKEQSSPVPQQQQQQPSPPLQIQNTGPCGEQFTNDSSVPCIVAKVSHNGRSETIKINKTATMKQFYLHVAWLFKGALPEGFRLVFSRIPKGCTYEKGVLPSDSDDTVEVLNKNLINVIS